MKSTGVRLLALVFLGISSCLLAACTGTLSPQAQTTRQKVYPTPSSPRDALVQFTEALHEADEAKLLAATQINEPQQRDFLSLIMDFIAACLSFRDAFVKAYGEADWKAFQDPTKGPTDGNATITISDKTEKVAVVRQVAIQEQGDQAFADVPEKPGGPIQKWRAVKGPEGWRVDAANVCPPGPALQQSIDQLKPMPVLLRKYQKAIGHPGIKAEDIDAELGRAILQSLKGITSPAPHRFDIDKIPAKG